MTLDAIDPAVDWYTDRPDRSTGEEPPDQFIGSTWARVYGQVDPNALLQYRTGTGIHGLFGSVSDPRYDRGPAGSPSPDGLQVHLRRRCRVGSFDAPVLTILNNLKPPAEGSSFALHTASSRLEADGAGGYRLVVGDVDEKVFAMNNAPGRAGDFETVSAFVDSLGRAVRIQPAEWLAGRGSRWRDLRILPLTLSSPAYDPATRTLTFAAIPLPDAGAPALDAVLRDAVLFVDSGPRATSSTVFSQTWRGFAYSAVPGRLHTIPQVKKSEAWDSDMTSDNFLAQWGTKDGCGRNDLQAMADAGVNVIRLYDYNYARDASAPTPGTAGHGHIAFLDRAQALGIKVIIPVSNWNFSNERYAWENIKNTVTQIVNSTKKGGAIHPAVHSFSVGNELDLGKYGLPLDVRISRAIEVVGLVHQQAPDHYVTIPISNADEKLYYGVFKSGGTLNGVAIQPVPAEIYRTRFYNSVQTFKLGGTPGDPGNALERDILEAYDDGGYGVPLVDHRAGHERRERRNRRPRRWIRWSARRGRQGPTWMRTRRASSRGSASSSGRTPTGSETRSFRRWTPPRAPTASTPMTGPSAPRPRAPT